MSMDQYEMSPETTQPPPKPGMSTGAKVLIALGVVFGALCLLCCGGVIALVYYVQSSVVSKDPATVVAKTNEITQIDIPDELRPQASFDMKVPFSGQRVMLWTVYVDKDTDSVLVLFAMGDISAEQDQEEMRKAMDQSLQQQGMQQREKLVVQETYKKEVEIRGQPATFTITKGVGEDSKKPRIQVMGVFQGKTGPAMLMLLVDAEKFTEEEILKMIESIE